MIYNVNHIVLVSDFALNLSLRLFYQRCMSIFWCQFLCLCLLYIDVLKRYLTFDLVIVLELSVPFLWEDYLV